MESTVEKIERQKQDKDQRSAWTVSQKISHSGKDYFNNYAADPQRLQISDLLFSKFLTQATFACWKVKFNSEVCSCSRFPTEAIQWIEKVVIVSSVDDATFASSTRDTPMPNFERHDAKTSSTLNKIIQEEFVWRNRRPRNRTVSFVVNRLLT